LRENISINNDLDASVGTIIKLQDDFGTNLQKDDEDKQKGMTVFANRNAFKTLLIKLTRCSCI
jgi:hypothetical protein